MRLEKLRVRNFRGLSDVTITTDKSLNVIVGPNAIGKTSLLEAIRLTKAILAPRYVEETGQVLVSLTATTQHMPFGIASMFDYSAIAGDITKPLIIELALRLSDDEHQQLLQLREDIAFGVLRSRLGRSDAQAQLALVQFLSSERGKAELDTARADVTQFLNFMPKDSVPLRLEIHPGGQFSGNNQLGQISISILESRLPPAWS